MKWEDLDYKQKGQLAKIYLDNGITSLDKMKDHYNSFAEGGSLSESDEFNEPVYIPSIAAETGWLPEVKIVADRPAWQKGLTDYDWSRARQYYSNSSGTLTPEGFMFLHNIASKRSTGKSDFMRQVDKYATLPNLAMLGAAGASGALSSPYLWGTAGAASGIQNIADKNYISAALDFGLLALGPAYRGIKAGIGATKFGKTVTLASELNEAIRSTKLKPAVIEPNIIRSVQNNNIGLEGNLDHKSVMDLFEKTLINSELSDIIYGRPTVALYGRSRYTPGIDYIERGVSPETTKIIETQMKPRLLADTDRSFLINRDNSYAIDFNDAINEAINDTKVSVWSKRMQDDYNRINNLNVGGFSLNDEPRIVLMKDSGMPISNIEAHEMRHQLQRYLPRTPAEKSILKDAYGDVPQPLRRDGSIDMDYDMSQEWETLNTEGRKILLEKAGYKYDDTKDVVENVIKQNKILEDYKEEELVNILKGTNGYWERFIEKLELKSPEEISAKVAAWKKAMQRVGVYVPTIGIGAATIQKYDPFFGANISPNSKLTTNLYAMGGKKSTEEYPPPDLSLKINDNNFLRINPEFVQDNTRYVRPYDPIQITKAKKKHEEEQRQKVIAEARKKNQPQLKADTRSDTQRQADYNRARQQEAIQKADEQAAIYGRAIGANHDMTVDEVNSNTINTAELAGFMAAPYLMTGLESGYYLGTNRPKEAAITAGFGFGIPAATKIVGEAFSNNTKISFIKNLGGVPEVDEAGMFWMSPENRALTNMTWDKSFRTHRNYKSRPGTEYLVYSPNAFKGQMNVRAKRPLFFGENWDNENINFEKIISGKEVNKTEHSIPQPFIDDINYMSKPRMTDVQRNTELPTKYYSYPFDENAFEKGFYDPHNNTVNVMEGYEDYALGHEIRHAIDNSGNGGVTLEQYKILKDAYNDDFIDAIDIKNFGIPSLYRERVTTNYDIRRTLLKEAGLDRATLEEQNEYLKNVTGNQLYNAMSVHGYGRRYLAAMLNNPKYTANNYAKYVEILKNIKKAMIAVPVLVPAVLHEDEKDNQ